MVLLKEREKSLAFSNVRASGHRVCLYVCVCVFCVRAELSLFVCHRLNVCVRRWRCLLPMRGWVSAGGGHCVGGFARYLREPPVARIAEAFVLFLFVFQFRAAVVAPSSAVRRQEEPPTPSSKEQKPFKICPDLTFKDNKRPIPVYFY